MRIEHREKEDRLGAVRPWEPNRIRMAPIEGDLRLTFREAYAPKVDPLKIQELYDYLTAKSTVFQKFRDEYIISARRRKLLLLV